MIFINPPLLPQFPDHLWTEALFISKTFVVGYKQASVHKNLWLLCFTCCNSVKRNSSPIQPSYIESCKADKNMCYPLQGQLCRVKWLPLSPYF